jgi:hypothetical protein
VALRKLGTRKGTVLSGRARWEGVPPEVRSEAIRRVRKGLKGEAAVDVVLLSAFLSAFSLQPATIRPQTSSGLTGRNAA